MPKAKTALQKRAAERRKRMTVTVTRHGDPEPPDHLLDGMTKGERIELALQLSRMAYGIKKAFTKDADWESTDGLPRHAYPVRVVWS